MSENTAPIYDDKAEVRGNLDLSNAEWQRPGGDQVEIAFVPHTDGATYVAMRNATEPDGTILVFTMAEWDAFVAGAKDGEFDEP
ncbi:uncharacterized protein DUF397 [Tamaricihabitans halophyticus]|uniref:Uncharacterized protein DUF397 n=1 Tax=Tamaricihabitans halophyticus TaxID=1262583 RepID=A0A4R2QSG7_9PSEU|nr:DUF397 domain-containing protein [Tamaricihabitans halophyticus]TCP52074.1 uncharacterized protein DUF397 [Tamaricihabitans halophyticus]